MTNEAIIFGARLKLMKDGKIGSTGRTIVVEDDEGNKTQMPEPEEIHTYAAWQRLGFQVKRGQKAIDKFQIWKHTVKKAEKEDEEDVENMFMVTSSFFSQSQVEVANAKN